MVIEKLMPAGYYTPGLLAAQADIVTYNYYTLTSAKQSYYTFCAGCCTETCSRKTTANQCSSSGVFH